MNNDDAIDLLQGEDRHLNHLFSELAASEGRDVKSRARYGDHCKQLLRHLAVREAAKRDLLRVLPEDEGLVGIQERLGNDREERQRLMNELDRMSRHVRAIELNRTQDVKGVVDRLRAVIVPEIEWELSDAIPEFRQRLTAAQRASLHRARYLRRHAPSRITDAEARWSERIGPLGSLLTLWDRLQDRPQPSRSDSQQ